MKIETIVVGELETNCYILSINDEYVIVDPGDDFDKIKHFLKNKNVVGCLITHFHFDHIGALEEVISEYDVSVNKINSDNFKYEVIETPGHTNDSKTFYFSEEKIMLTGDFLFKDSIGRTDLGGSPKDMEYSLELIKKYDDDIIIYPGHGNISNLGKEKENFKFYKQLL